MTTIMRFGALVAAASFLLVAGCTEDQAARSYVQANVVDKDVFEGEWYYRSCVIRTDDEAGEMAFPGDCSADWINFGGGAAVPRIRWMIDRDYLFAIRSYDYVEGANVETAPLRGEPVLAFKILSHFDIRRDYNPTTGEEVNVLVENDFDQHWSDRQYMRVDWSENLVMTMDVFTAALYDAVQIYTRDPAPSFVQEGGDSTGVQWPDTYRPRFVRTSVAEDQQEGVTRVADYGAEGELYYMDFVTQEVFTPGMVNDPYTGQLVPWCMSVYIDSPICTSSLMTVRNAFLKIPPERDYEAQEWPDSRFNQFGFWRLGRPTYDQSDAVDPTDPHWGMTDFWTQPVSRFNIWQDTRDAAGNLIPEGERDVRPVYFYTTTEFPLHLLRPAVRIAAEWNRYYMKLVRILRGQALPEWDDGVPDADGTVDEVKWIFDPDTGGAYTCSAGPNAFGECPLEERQPAADSYDCRIAIDARDQGTPELPAIGRPAGVGSYKAYDQNVRADTDFTDDRWLSMEGPECVVVGRVNSCIRHPAGRDGPNDPGEACEERGDMRYSFLSYVNEVSTGWSGVAEMRADPVTGEFIVGEANVGGSQLDIWRTRVLSEIDLETGKYSEEAYYMGEEYREYIDNLGGNVDRPAIPQRELPPVDALTSGPAAIGVPYSEMTRNMERAFARAEQLKGEAGRANIYSDRVRSLVGSDLERVLFDNEEAMAANDIAKLSPGVTSTAEGRLDLASLFRTPLPQRMAEERRMENRYMRGSVTRPPIFVDHSVGGFVERLEASFPGILDREPQLTFLLDQYLYRPLIIHEFGHVLGLRHNFAGSADRDNYFPQYYAIEDANPWPDEADYDTDEDGHLNNMEMVDFAQAQEQVKRDRQKAGSKVFENAAIMDYTGNWYDELAGMPSYDVGAMYFGYGDIVEVWETDGTTAPRPDRNRVHYWKYYNGGESCSTDSDCPFAAGTPGEAALMAEQVDAGVTQRCVDWNTTFGTTRGCSNMRDDVRDRTTNYVDRRYKFCTDDNQDYTADCSVFDEGGTYREIVQNAKDYWERAYLRFAFRRYRHTFDYYPYISGFMRFYSIGQKIFQNLFYNWAANIGDYRTSTAPFSFYDQYMASVDVLNWYIQTLALPNVGSYLHESWRDRYSYSNRYIDQGDLNVPLGVGKYMYSLYQGGLDGINRLERIGMLYDKLWTLEMMLVRDWGFAYTRDEPYFVNMYDLFPSEIGYLMTGLLADEPSYYMPRVLQPGSEGTDTKLIYPLYWRGACRVDDSGASPCWAADESMSALVPVQSDSFYVQMVGVTYGLSEIPTPFDPTFQEQATVYVVGSGGGARVPPDSRLCPVGSSEDCDYAVFTSDRYHRQYLAFKVEAGADGIGAGASLGFAIVQKAEQQNELLGCLEQALVDAGGEWGGQCLVSGTDYCSTASILAATRCAVPVAEYSTALGQMRSDVDGYESFIRYLLELQGRYGLNTWISYTGSM
ncbi:MAG: zinc-dependent metalloprotease [Deltaproteobacteria bacterium]|nr:zinc-dependent metalloprotease [Deltaproteobacteria bacterium]